MSNIFVKKSGILLVVVLVLQSLFVYADNSVVVEDKTNKDKIYVEETKIDSLEQLKDFKNEKFKNKFDLLKESSAEKFVSGVKRTYYVSETVDKSNQNRVVDSHLMTNDEVKKYKNRKLMYLSDYDVPVGSDAVERYALTLYLYVTEKSNGVYSCHGAAEWDRYKFNSSDETAPSINGKDYILLSWGGKGNLIATKHGEITGTYSNGDSVWFGKDGMVASPTKGYSWSFSELDSSGWMNTYATDIESHVDLSRKHDFYINGEAGVNFQYVHTYNYLKESLGITYEDEEFGLVIKTQETPNRWSIRAIVEGLKY